MEGGKGAGLPEIIYNLLLAEITHTATHNLEELHSRRRNNGTATGELKRHSLQ